MKTWIVFFAVALLIFVILALVMWLLPVPFSSGDDRSAGRTAKNILSSDVLRGVESMDHAETLAQRIFELVISGARMEFRSSQSHGEYDFALHYTDGRVAAVEITSSVDQALVETHHAILGNGGSAIERLLCKHDWLIHPLPDAPINAIRKKADRYLADIEEAAIERFVAATDQNPSVKAIYRDLRVISGSVEAWIKPGNILMTLPGTGDLIQESTVFDAAEREAFKKDNRQKLNAAPTPERHLAIYVYCTAPAWVPLCDLAPTSVLPRLPNEITDIWMFSENFTPGECVVWRAGSSLKWVKQNLVLQST